MSLIENFQFSQASLQDFMDCRRRFQLRYLQHVVWPAVESEPILENERYLQQGARFHHMIQQHLVGVPAESLSGFAREEDLGRWWENYLAFAPLVNIISACIRNLSSNCENALNPA